MKKFSFTATIYKVGINPCVPVPEKITDSLKSVKGYIHVKGTINGFPFVQTLVPIKDDLYRLYVNGPMLKGGKTANGETATFVIEQNLNPEQRDPGIHPSLKKKLKAEKLLADFQNLTPYRQKEINRYLASLKTTEALERNLVKVIAQLKQKSGK